MMYTATIKKGVSGSKYIEVNMLQEQGGVELVPLVYSYQKALNLIAKGYLLNDPQHLVTCPGCGELTGGGACDICNREEADRRDEQQMYSDLREGL